MAQQQSFRLVEFVGNELYKLCQEKHTGMLFITSPDHRLVQLGVDQGEIVSLAFQNKQGLQALLSLQTQDFKVNVSRFVEWQTSPARQKDLPSTKDILEQLTGNKGQPSAPVKPDNDGPLTDKVKAIVEQELTEFMGPMAAIVCEETWGSVSNLVQALDALCQELSDTTQAARFQQNVFKRLA